MTDIQTDAVTVFKPDIGFLISFYSGAFFIMGFGLLPFVLLWQEIKALGLTAGAAVYPVFILLGWWAAYWVSQHRLILSPEGIEFHLPFFKMYSSWDNVAGLGLDTNWQICLYLQDPGLRSAQGLLGRLSGAGVEKRAIPLWRFMKRINKTTWRNTALSEALLTYLPNLIAFREPDN